MFKAIRNFFALPVFEGDPVRTDTARTTHNVLLALLGIAVLGSLVALRPGTTDLTGVIVSFISFFVWLGCIVLNRRGYTLSVNIIIIALNTLSINGIVYASGGFPSLTAIANILIIALATLLLPPRGTIGVAVATLILLIALYLVLPGKPIILDGINLLLVYSFTAITSAFVLEIAAGNFRRATLRAFTTEDELREKNEQLQTFSEGLETLVNQRTTELQTASLQLERRASQFRAIANISRSIATLQDVDTLLNTITAQISSQFNIYHAGIFLTDENKELAILRATNSVGGQRMLARGHRLRVGAQGIVGYVTQLGRPRIALDTGVDATYFNNPDLPATRSEAALPLIIGNEIIGALDVQSEQSAAFNENDIEILGILADQVAIAIQNARLYAQTAEALKEAQQTGSERIRSDWARFAGRAEHPGYRLAGASVEPIRERIETDELRQAIQKGTVEASPDGLGIPIKLRGQTIGVIGLRARNKTRQWSESEIATAQAAAERVALAVENARLVEESQRRAALERMTSDISGKIGASLRFETILRTAAEEISRALSGSDVLVQIQPESINDGQAVKGASE